MGSKNFSNPDSENMKPYLPNCHLVVIQELIMILRSLERMLKM
jgi:hypothetical protein